MVYNQYMSNKYSNSDDNERSHKMVLRSMHVDLFWWNQAKAKAERNRIPLAVIIRQLVKAWVKGDISVTLNNED